MTTPVEYLSFDRIADSYETTRYIPPVHLRQTARLIADDKGFEPYTQSPFLDAGVGTGRFARYLSEIGIQTVGVDISAEMLRHARRSAPRLPLVRGDLRQMPFATGAFSGAMLVHILHLIADWRRVLDEIRRVLAPGAPLYVGSESGKNFKTRNLYFQVAAECGYTRPNVGANSVDIVLEHLQETGAALTPLVPRQGPSLRWTASASVEETLEALRGNPFSHLWHLTPEDHAGLMLEVEARAKRLFPNFQIVEEAPVVLSLWRVKWNPL